MKFYGIRGIADNFAKGLREGVVILKNQPKANKAEKDKDKIVLDSSALEKNLEIIKRSDLFWKRFKNMEKNYAMYHKVKT